MLPARLITSIFPIGQTLFVASLGIYVLLIAFNNITDYQTNFLLVQHVMSMDTIPFKASTHWRSVHSTYLHHAAYIAIILWQASAGAFCVLGAVNLSGCVFKPNEFRKRIALAAAGLWLSLGLWLVPFLIVAHEWFLTWQSSQLSGDMSPFQMFVLTGLALLLLTTDRAHSA